MSIFCAALSVGVGGALATVVFDAVVDAVRAAAASSRRARASEPTRWTVAISCELIAANGALSGLRDTVASPTGVLGVGVGEEAEAAVLVFAAGGVPA